MLNDVEADSLGKRTALADGNDVSLLDGWEGRRQVSRDVTVALLETSVLGDEVKVVTTEDDRAGHLVGDDNTTEDAAADGNTSGPGALVVNVLSIDSSGGSLDSQTDALEPASTAKAILARLRLHDAHASLLLVRLLALYVHFVSDLLIIHIHIPFTRSSPPQSHNPSKTQIQTDFC